MKKNSTLIEKIKKANLKEKKDLIEQLDRNLLTNEEVKELSDYLEYLVDYSTGNIEYTDNPEAYDYYWKELKTYEERDEFTSKFTDIVNSIYDICNEKKEKFLREEYEEEYSENGLRQKLRKDFKQTVLGIFYCLGNYDSGDYYEIDQSTGEDLTTKNKIKAEIIKKMSENPEMIKILIEESEKQGIDTSYISNGKEFEYIGLNYAYGENKVKFIDDKLPSLVESDENGKKDYSKKNMRFVNELMKNPEVRLIYLKKTDDELVGEGYYDCLVAVSNPDVNGISRILDSIPVPVLRKLGIDINKIMEGVEFKDNYLGIADGISNNGDDAGSLNKADYIIDKMSKIYEMSFPKKHNLDEVRQMVEETLADRTISDISAITKELNSAEQAAKDNTTNKHAKKGVVPNI